MFQRVIWLASIAVSLFLSPAYAWQISDYDVQIQLNQNSRFVVVETIQAEFGNESKHGIYRDIPTTYDDENGNPYDVRFQVLEVTDQDQIKRDYVEERQSNFMRIKIGRADRTVSGLQTYVITYQVTGAILFLPDHDELFWNAVGTQWDVPIKHVFVSVSLPEGMSWQSIKLASYTGPSGSRTSNATQTVVDEKRVTFEGSGYRPYEGFTIVVGMPKGVLVKPNNSQDGLYRKISFGYWYLFIPVLMFILVFKLWYRLGKDPYMDKSIVVEYKAPDDLKPAEVGYLIDSNIDQRDISASIIDLAIRGYLKIVQEKGLLGNKNYTLVLLKPFYEDAALKKYEIKILSGIFGGDKEGLQVKLSDLENRFYKSLEDINFALLKDDSHKGIFLTEGVGMLFLFIFIGVIFIPVGIMMLAFDGWLAAAFFLTSIIFISFGIVMPKRTFEGAEVLSRILGFKEFLIRTEKDKIQKAEQQDIFERMLPYAICLGVSTKWASKFDGIYAQPPQWFHGDYQGTFHHDRFLHDLDHSINRMGTSFYSRPQSVSSGGGFSSGGHSGGGHGGGGGGSW